ncbi:MAG: hypothetical protein CML46_18945 [Rhodobacteraceae bacterium]|nr:hypothetical protein [Paracoccaceae bacterium]MBR28991.1 hypothetical protein [Paracoccaceae bacterium]
MFDTPLTLTDGILSGPLRAPRQMLADQAYDGHTSIHDDAMAEKLGFRAGPIEGPTHFSQFEPLLSRIWGRAWFEQGCLSVHFLNMVVEGEEVRAFVRMPEDGARRAECWAEKADGTRVLDASATLGPDHPETLLESRKARLRPPGKLVILEDLRLGMTGRAGETATMGMDDHMGDLYPFTLRRKLDAITETMPAYSDDAASPWGRAAIPMEMISVLAAYGSKSAGFPVKGPAIGLYADLEMRLIDGPLFVGETYGVHREIAAIAESGRTESYWTRTTLSDLETGAPRAVVLLNHAVLKASYEGYEDRRKALEAAG